MGQYSSGGYTNNIAIASRIDHLTGTKLNSITVNGVSGLTAADIPTNIIASNYLPLAGGTLTGDLTLTGNLTVSDAVEIAQHVQPNSTSTGNHGRHGPARAHRYRHRYSPV
jgi:hypothetical protein